jgi:2-polyprenyl-3-methyl-5-hydroxy-6-metoxy-1,4-benzoquinol methylase
MQGYTVRNIQILQIIIDLDLKFDNHWPIRLSERRGENMKQWYEALFENYAHKYDSECFVQGTMGECNFIEQEIKKDKSLKILDIGCGTGRHTIELTKRGYHVTGVDLSENQIKRAREKAQETGVTINFQTQDARNLPFDGEFDLVIMLCEGGFSLMETDEMNFEILRNAKKALKNNGKLIFTTLNGLFPLFHSVSEFYASAQKEGQSQCKDCSFDLMTFRDHNTAVIEDDSGNKRELQCNERYYTPSEITWLLKTLGFKKIDIIGAKLGAFSRSDKLTIDDFEMLIVAE